MSFILRAIPEEVYQNLLAKGLINPGLPTDKKQVGGSQMPEKPAAKPIKGWRSFDSLFTFQKAKK